MPGDASELIATARKSFPQITPAEEKLFSETASGQVANYCAGGAEIDDPANSDKWGPDRTISATCIRWLCVTPNIKNLLGTKRVRIQGAKIEGELRLDHAEIDLCGDRSEIGLILPV